MSTAVFVTGASRGFGRALAVESAKRIAGRVVLVLTARTEEDLRETARLAEEAAAVRPSRAAGDASAR